MPDASTIVYAPESARFEKVAVFVVRTSPSGLELLTFLHPTAGRQLPAGSVEPGEPIEEAALREVREETGVAPLTGLACLGEEVEDLGDEAVALRDARITEPCREGLQVIKRGHKVRIENVAGETYSVAQLLYDLTAEPSREVPGIRGKAARADFARRLRRTFWFARAENDGRGGWTQAADGHDFRVDWTPLVPTPNLVTHQARWLAAHRDAIVARFEQGAAS